MMIVPGSAFIPKAAGDPYWDNVVLLMHMDGANGSTTFVDEKGHTVTAHGYAEVSTVESKYGGASAAGFYTGGSVDKLTVPASTDFELTGDFTIEAFVHTADLSSSNNTFLDLRSGGGGVFLIKVDTARTLSYYRTSTISGTDAYPLNTWFHVAFCRVGSTLSAYLDGVHQFDVTETQNTDSSTSPTIGNGYVADFTSPLNGYIDELRITKGVARYTADFTVPSTPFPNS